MMTELRRCNDRQLIVLGGKTHDTDCSCGVFLEPNGDHTGPHRCSACRSTWPKEGFKIGTGGTRLCAQRRTILLDLGERA